MSENLIRLPHRFISIKGIDAEKFLQGQASCDLTKLDSDHFSFGTLNTPKGRIYSLFKIIRVDNGFLLSLQESTVELTLKTLKKYKVFFKCEIETPENIHAYGLLQTGLVSDDNKALDNTPFYGSKLPNKSRQLIRYEQNYCFRLSASKAMLEFWMLDENTSSVTTQVTEEKWFAYEASQGLPELYIDSQEKFILQELNLQDLGAVSFQKGCYTGQEIITRMKYRGKQKKKMFVLHSAQNITAEINPDITDINGKKVGTLARIHWHEQPGTTALAVLNIEYAVSENHAFINGSFSTPFEINQIIYPPES